MSSGSSIVTLTDSGSMNSLTDVVNIFCLGMASSSKSPEQLV